MVRPTGRGSAFTSVEDEQLRRLCGELPRAELATLLNRSEASIGKRINRLGLREASRAALVQGGKGRPKQRNGREGWQPWELELLKDPEMPLVEVAELTGRTYTAIRHRASRERLVGIRDYWLTGPANPKWVGGPEYQIGWRGSDWPEFRLVLPGLRSVQSFWFAAASPPPDSLASAPCQ